MQYIELYFRELIELLFDMSPWLILGFLIAGILHVFFPDGQISKLLGSTNTRSVIRAALIGIPLPLCSCGVIPTGVSIHKNGASKGAAVSFLISTPQTGVDSIMVTYSLLGLPFALVRPVVALLTGITGGFFTNKLDPAMTKVQTKKLNITSNPKQNSNKFKSIFSYAFVDFLQDIAKWLVIGLLIAALIAILVPDDFFVQYIKSEFLGMLIILIASVPLYVCATSSVPIAAVLMMKGISPGAALVFLMAGPATNAATISVIGNSMGEKTLLSYLITIIIGSLLFGLFIDNFLPREWFLNAITSEHMNHEHGLLPRWLQISAGIIMILALINVWLKKYYVKWFTKPSEEKTETNYKLAMSEIKVMVKGMNCSHCKANVENCLKNLEGIESIDANVEKEEVTITGNHIDLEQVKNAVEEIGYKYHGKIG